MELLSFAKEVVQNIAEHAASYRLGQTALKQLDRALWVVEKCARWAVPPPLDQDERPQPELVRPLPWVLFLPLLIAMRITRESISLVNLVLGKPPLRSADVVMYIQSKRRYLRTLKYQGNRIIRARAASSQREPWYSRLQSQFQFTMCFRRSYYGNNNTTNVSNNDEVLVVRRNKRGREPAGSVASASETTMERLIEKMMVDLDAESDDDSSFTLTNATSIKSDTSEDSEPEHGTLENHNDQLDPSLAKNTSLETANVDNNSTPEKNEAVTEDISNNTASPKEIATPTKKSELSEPNNVTPEKSETVKDDVSNNPTNPKEIEPPTSKSEIFESNNVDENPTEKTEGAPEYQDAGLQQRIPKKTSSPKEDTHKFLETERCTPQKNQQSPKNSKIANGRLASAPNRKRGMQTQRRDAPSSKFASANQS